MRFKNAVLMAVTVLVALTATGLSRTAQTAQAEQNWKARVGAQSKDLGNQAIAFLPNEIWIHEYDSITWTSASNDIHTVTFLKVDQVYPPFPVGCPGFSLSGASFDGSHCVSAAPFVNGGDFTVKFPKPGNFKLVCLVHPNMTGVIHVLPAAAPLPHNQAFYRQQAADQERDLLTDTDKKHEGHHGMEMDGKDGKDDKDEDRRDMDDMFSMRVLRSKKVVAGTGEIAATPGGFQSLAVMRFSHGTVEVHVGDTVEWGNEDPATPHTITFGAEPLNPVPPAGKVTMDADGALHATIGSAMDNVHSGLIGATTEDRIGVPQSRPGITRFRITFTKAGTFNYICALHDGLGMVGKVIVRP